MAKRLYRSNINENRKKDAELTWLSGLFIIWKGLAQFLKHSEFNVTEKDVVYYSL